MANLFRHGFHLDSGDPTTANETTPFIDGQLGKVTSETNTALFSPGRAPRVYQYVQRSATDAVTPAVGQIAYWKDLDNFIVTTDVSDAAATNGGLVAGFFPSASLAAGKYGCIQVAGVGPVLLKGSPTATAAAGSVIFVDAGGADAACDCTDNFADAAAVTNAGPIVATALTAKNAGSIGTHVVEALIHPTRHSW